MFTYNIHYAIAIIIPVIPRGIQRKQDCCFV